MAILGKNQFRKNTLGRRAAVGILHKIASRHVVVSINLDRYTDQGYEIERNSMGCQIPPWKHLKAEERVQISLETMLRANGFKTYQVTFHLNKKLSHTPIERLDLHRVRGEFRKVLNNVIPEQDKYFFLIPEYSDQGKTHIHGAMMLNARSTTNKQLKQIQSATKLSSMCRSHRQYYKNKTVFIADQYKKGETNELVNIDSGWGVYVTKELENHNRFTMTSELRSLAKENLARLRSKEGSVSYFPVSSNTSGKSANISTKRQEYDTEYWD